MSWEGYLTRLKGTDGSGTQPIAEAAIWGQNPLSVWATTDGLKDIKAEELQLLSKDRHALQQGMTIGGHRCVLLRDDLDTEDIFTINLKTRADAQGNRYCISIGKSKQAFIIVKGALSAQGGQVPNMMYGVLKYLRESGY
ncbi:unnamed protein product [Tetraodon nigroviridis]|uniref:Profilin n=1 Tax=Tetraodon nigroviridis TaxID=99883 RepID=Q4TA25_TETNG|nr:unnamed protein product [Tetraodon nigroviridis]